MKVIVEIIMGRFIDAVVSENATVKELKEKIAMEVKLPAKRLIIVVGHEETRRIMMEYENEMLLRDLGVKEYSHVYLFFKNPDHLVSREERLREEGDDDNDPMEEMSSEAESRRQNEEEDEELEEEEKVKIGNEKEDEEMKDEEEEDGDEKVEDENNGDEANDDVYEEAREDEEGDNKEETLTRVS